MQWKERKGKRQNKRISGGGGLWKRSSEHERHIQIRRSGQIAADVPQVEGADLIPSSCDGKGVHYPPHCSIHPPPPPNIPPSSVGVTLDGVSPRVRRPEEGREIGALTTGVGTSEEEIFGRCPTAGHRLAADPPASVPGIRAAPDDSNLRCIQSFHFAVSFNGVSRPALVPASQYFGSGTESIEIIV